MSKKSLIALLLALCMVLSACPVFAAGTAKEPLVFSDVPETHWAHKFVSEMTAMGLFSGTSTPVDGVGTFSPDKTMTRAEFLTVTVNQLYGSDFAKMQPASPWYKNTYDLAVSKGLITSSEFTLNDMQYGMSRQEMAMIVVRAMEVMGNTSTKKLMPQSRIPDYDYIREYYKVYVQKCYANGCIGGTDSKGTFNPWGVLTRAQASVVLYHLIVPESRGHYDESMLVEEPATAYLTDKRMVIAGKPYAGLIKIKDGYYYPLQYSDYESEIHSSSMDFISIHYSYVDENYLRIVYSYPHVTADWKVAPAAVGKALGTAEPSVPVLNYNITTDTREYFSTYTIGGRSLMVAVEAFGKGHFEGNDYVINEGEAVKYVKDSLVIHDNSADIAAGLIKNTNKETAKAIHDYVINTLSYGEKDQLEDYWSRLPINETLRQKKGVCADYSTLFQSMCRAAGIPCLIQSGTANGGGHGWNRIYIDGQWTNVDCTWDDPIGGKPRNKYFMISSNDLAADHYWTSFGEPWIPYDYPIRLTEYDPAWEQLDPMKVNSREMYLKVLTAQLNMGKTSFSIKCPSGCYATPDIAMYLGNFCGSLTWKYNSKTGCYDYKVTMF